jgi:hypothetical protein
MSWRFFKSGLETVYQLFWATVILALTGLVTAKGFRSFQRLTPVWQDRADTIIATCAIIVIVSLFGVIVSGRYRVPRQASSQAKDPRRMPHIVTERGRVERVAIDEHLHWRSAQIFDSSFLGGFVGIFSNQAHSKFPRQTATRVKAAVRLKGIEGRSVTADPAPWLNSTSPYVSFEPGESHELLIGIFDHVPDNLPADQFVLHGETHGMVDLRERGGVYVPTANLSGRLIAEVSLVVDGIARGPFTFGLDPSLPPAPPVCRPMLPPTWRSKTRARVQRVWPFSSWLRKLYLSLSS